MTCTIWYLALPDIPQQLATVVFYSLVDVSKSTRNIANCVPQWRTSGRLAFMGHFTACQIEKCRGSSTNCFFCISIILSWSEGGEKAKKMKGAQT